MPLLEKILYMHSVVLVKWIMMNSQIIEAMVDMATMES